MRVSLNSPVLQIDEFPTGPARAVVLAYVEESGAPRLAVALRAQLSGELQVYAGEQDLNDLSSSDLPLGSAVRFAEGLGFVLDSDLVQPDEPEARARALSLWTSFVSDPGASSDDMSHEPELLSHDPGEADPVEELLLVDRVDPDPALEVEPDTRSRPPLQLSKFRPPAKAGAESAPLGREKVAPAAGGSPLGRVSLVRRSVDVEGAEKPNLLLRLLGAF